MSNGVSQVMGVNYALAGRAIDSRPKLGGNRRPAFLSGELLARPAVGLGLMSSTLRKGRLGGY
jgi:hypothetical protein